MSQNNTFRGKRGLQEISGITMNDLYTNVHDRVFYALLSMERGNSVDPHAVAQHFCCNVEKTMGIYPNISDKKNENS